MSNVHGKSFFLAYACNAFNGSQMRVLLRYLSGTGSHGESLTGRMAKNTI